ncbi:hypothetical protein Taro_029753, partial [Colocasia esculenta]|nr:hypothetical protein [Colocasia esculenta]
MISLSSQTNELYQLASVAFCLLVAWDGERCRDPKTCSLCGGGGDREASSYLSCSIGRGSACRSVFLGRNGGLAQEVSLDLVGFRGNGQGSCESLVAGEVATRRPMGAKSWSIERGTYPFPGKKELRVKLVGAPLSLCDEEGYVFLVQRFGKLMPGTLRLVPNGRMICLEAVVLAESPYLIPPILLVDVGGIKFTVRASNRLVGQQRKAVASGLGFCPSRLEEEDD